MDITHSQYEEALNVCQRYLRQLDDKKAAAELIITKINNHHKITLRAWINENSILMSNKLFNVLNREATNRPKTFVDDIGLDQVMKFRGCGEKTAREFIAMQKQYLALKNEKLRQ